MNGAGRVPAARYRSRRGRRRSNGAGRASSAEPRPEPAGAARIALVQTTGGLGPSAPAELRLVVLDDGRRLRVDAEQISRLGLEPGLLLDSSTLTRLECHDAYRRAREAALRLLAARPRSTAELRARLHRAGVPADTAASVIVDLTRDGYLGDLEFARAWVRSRLAIRPCGLLRLRSELREKGVAIPLIEQAIREVHGEEDAAVAEERRARALAERRLRLFGRLTWEVRVRRVAGFLQRRGFTTQTIARVLRAVGQSSRGETSDAS